MITSRASVCLLLGVVSCAGAAPPATEAPAPATQATDAAPTPVAPAPVAAVPAAASSAELPSKPRPATPPPVDERAAPNGLARGTDDASDRQLSLGDLAYEAEKYKEARQHYRKAEQLAPQDPAPKVGLVRVSVAEADLPLDYASAPKDARIPALLKQLEGALKLDP